MSDTKIDPKDIGHLAESLHEMTIPETRAVALAKELDQLNATALSQSRTLAYDVDAFGYAGVLQRLKRPRRQA